MPPREAAVPFPFNSGTATAAANEGIGGPVLGALALHIAFLFFYLLAFKGDVSALVCVPRALVGQRPFEKITTGLGADGYDGQFYYVLARNPWQPHNAYVDFPAYRHARIVLPALAWLVTGGDPEALLWAFPAINLLAIAGIAALGTLLARHYGRSPWWGFLLPLALNVGMPMLRDLTDPVGTLTAVGVLAAWFLNSRSWIMALWAVAAVLSREQNVAVVGIVLLAALLRRDWLRTASCAGALVAWGTWIVALHAWYGEWPFYPGLLSLPLQGIAATWSSMAADASLRHKLINIVGHGFVILQVIFCLSLPFFRADRVTILLSLAAGALALCSSADIYEHFFSYARVFVWLPLAIWLWSMQSGKSWPALLASAAALWPCITVAQVWVAQ